MYIVYRHTTPSNKVYIGITCKKPNERWRNGKGYNYSLHFSSAIKKYGWENIKHDILFSGLTKEEAEQKEIELIRQYKATDRRYGYNLETGGNATKNLSEETKRKISKAHTGMKYGEEFRRGISEQKKGNKNKLGYKTSQETKRKISEKNKGKYAGEKNYFHTHKFYGERNPRAKAVEKYDLKGNFIESKNCVEDFVRELKITNSSHIIAVCKGKRKTAHGFIWKYAGKGAKANELVKQAI